MAAECSELGIMNNSYTIAAAVLQLPIIINQDLKYNSNESSYVCNYTADSVYYIGCQEYNSTSSYSVV